MLLSAALIVATFSYGLEMVFAFKIPGWRRLATRFEIASIIMSLALSWVIGTLFAAGGLIVMMAALISTGASYVTYITWDYIEAEINVSAVKQGFKDFGKVLYVTFRIITFPVRLVRTITNGFKSASATVKGVLPG